MTERIKKPPEYPQFHPLGTRSAALEPQQQLVFVLCTFCNEHTSSKAIVFFNIFWIDAYRNSNNKESTDAAEWITKWTVVKARWQPEIYLTLGAMRLGECGLHMMYDNVFAYHVANYRYTSILDQTLFFSRLYSVTTPGINKLLVLYLIHWKFETCWVSSNSPREL